jgi:hypothetical protein
VFEEGIQRRDSRKEGCIQRRYLRKAFEEGIRERKVFEEGRYSSKQIEF